MKKQVTEQALIKVANARLINMPEYEVGMQIYTATMVSHILNMTGEFFLESDGKATLKTVKALALYEKLAKELGDEYQVVCQT